ncbi:UDP-glucuronosyltransferase 3A1 isoform X2 [Perognathus longimembris pacificus]|uniref:UDP-glucuronosyltransferase 3A1 isoform X2 n=1 Tax=Perognathus longimembris pacificus TaxID=214514 RepID=UPI0020183E94|nr:UDP-glucuronosyltransferase 3A1 isoform X2 [Perognathus longimembris pacificus]
MDRVSEILQEHGHQVISLLYDIHLNKGLIKERKLYKVLSWVPHEDNQREYHKVTEFLLQESFHGRENFNHYVKLYESLGTLCSDLLSSEGILDSLRNENTDLIILDSVDFCSLLIAEKLGKPFVCLFPVALDNSGKLGLASPLSHVSVYYLLLNGEGGFWSLIKNILKSVAFSMKQKKIYSTFDNTIKQHFAEGSRPVLSRLPHKAEIWFVNSDFALDFVCPLFPNTIHIGGLLDKPVMPLPQELEDFIAKFEKSGFVLVSLGSILSSFQSQTLLEEMNNGFSLLPQGVIWSFQSSLWPKELKLATNVKIMDWIPQNDLLAHPGICVFVTHGGINSVNEAIQHGVPIVGIPVNGDQPTNMFHVEAKQLGISLPVINITAETLALKVKQVIEDKRYKSAAVAASIIRLSQPLTPEQRLVGWIHHILQTKGAEHLRPYAFQQPWTEFHLLIIFLFLLGFTLGTLWLCGKLLSLLTQWLKGPWKLKKM